MRLASYWVTAALVLISTPSARGAEVLDQSNDTTGSGISDSTSGSYLEQAQTFTVGVNGTLSRIAVQINYPNGFPGNLAGNAILTVYSTVGGVPSASLGSATLPSGGIPSGGYAYRSFDLSSLPIPISVHVGDVLAYGVTSSVNSYFFLRRSVDNGTYTGGQSLWRQRDPNGPWTAYSPPHDGGFQTYVLEAVAGLPGDFNSDGKVDAGDYAKWRKNDAANAALPNDNSVATQVARYTLWRSNFGKPPGSGSGLEGSEVPEPATLLLLIAGCGCVCGLPRRRS